MSCLYYSPFLFRSFKRQRTRTHSNLVAISPTPMLEEDENIVSSAFTFPPSLAQAEEGDEMNPLPARPPRLSATTPALRAAVGVICSSELGFPLRSKVPGGVEPAASSPDLTPGAPFHSPVEVFHLASVDPVALAHQTQSPRQSSSCLVAASVRGLLRTRACAGLVLGSAPSAWTRMCPRCPSHPCRWHPVSFKAAPCLCRIYSCSFG
jgi:hypothetical protein